MNDTRGFLGQAHCGNGATRLILRPRRQHLQVPAAEEKNKQAEAGNDRERKSERGRREKDSLVINKNQISGRIAQSQTATRFAYAVCLLC